MQQSRASRSDTHGARRIGVSFEFFPPKTEEMEKNLWDAAFARFRVGDLWRRRLHA
jgi:5,10-methylenetetrahydrofolate reductase